MRRFGHEAMSAGMLRCHKQRFVRAIGAGRFPQMRGPKRPVRAKPVTSNAPRDLRLMRRRLPHSGAQIRSRDGVTGHRGAGSSFEFQLPQPHTWGSAGRLTSKKSSRALMLFPHQRLRRGGKWASRLQPLGSRDGVMSGRQGVTRPRNRDVRHLATRSASRPNQRSSPRKASVSPESGIALTPAERRGYLAQIRR